MRTMARTAVAGAAGLGLLIGAMPAHATTAGAFAFVGTATVVPSPVYPFFGPASNGSWTMSTYASVGASTDRSYIYPVTVGTAQLNVSGYLHAGAVQQVLASGNPPLAYLGSGGFCGASGGSGGTGYINLTGLVSTYSAGAHVSNVGWMQSAASLIVYQGDTNAGRNYLNGVASALPNPTVGSCTNGTAVSFIVVGASTAIFNSF